MRIGCHMSVSKGFANMLQRAQGLGADVVQYFPKNPKSYRVKSFDAHALRQEAEEAVVWGVDTVCHSPYVTNLATADPELQKLSIASIVNDLEIADAYNTPYLVVHCGKHVGQGEEKGQQLMIDAINAVLEHYKGQVTLLLENTAGQGSELGYSIDQLLAIWSGIEQKERVGVCFDTCHAFAGGVFAPDDWETTVAELGREEFRKLVKVVHLNDSKLQYASQRDRHALLGDGEIGTANLARFVKEGFFPTAPIIIETPVDKEEDYADEIRKVRDWLKD